MNSFVSTWNTLMTIATFAGIIVSLALLYVLALPNDSFSRAVGGFVTKYILGIGLLISLAAFVGSFVYSNVIGYPPCELCWFARTMFYPQIILFLIALFKKDRKILDYALALTAIGIIVTLYNSIIQITGQDPLPCTVGGVSCVTRDVFEYGFITIPFMGLMGFVTLFFSILVAKRGSKTSVS